MEAQNFYTWWTTKVKGDYISNTEMEAVLEKFNNNCATNTYLRNLKTRN